MKLNYPDAPFPRSTLAPLEPFCLNTPLAESVESYVLRLAKEHRVTRFHIEFLVSESGPAPLYQNTSRQPFRVDSAIENAREFTRRLALLTHVPAVETMGLGWLAGKISVTGALRDHRAWCSQCLGKTQASGRDSYLPLAWSLRSYEICIEHGGAIQSSCPSCSKRIDIRREWAIPFTHCPHCARSLGRPESTAGGSLRDLERRKVREVDQRAARYLGELVAVAPQMRDTQMLDSPDVSKLVASAIAREKARNASNLAALAGVNVSTLHGLAVTRSCRPSLDILARLAVAADVSIIGTLCPSLWSVGPETGNGRTSTPLPPRRVRAHIAWDEVEREANAQMRLTRPESPCGLAKRLKFGPTHFKKQLPETFAKLADLYRKGQLAEREAVRTKMVARICDYINSQSQGGKRTGYRAVTTALDLHRSNQDVRLAWATVRDHRRKFDLKQSTPTPTA